MWWGILDLSGLADEEGIVSDQHSDKCKQTAMTDLETTSMTDLECVICDDADGAERQCSQLLPAITQLQKNVNLIKFAYLAETPTSTKVQILEFRGAYEEVFNTLELVIQAGALSKPLAPQISIPQQAHCPKGPVREDGHFTHGR